MSTHHRRTTHTSGINYEQLGWKCKHQGKYEEAIDAFDKAIVRKQRPYVALHGKGECLLDLGKYSDALNCFENAIKIDRHHAWAYHGAGRAYHYLKKYDLALAYYDKSIQITRQSVVAWHWKGRTLIRMDEYVLAEEALKTALKNAIGSKYGRNAIPLIEADLFFAKAHKIEMAHPSNGTPNRGVVIIGDNNAPIIFGDNKGPINNGGNQATDDAIQNRPIIMGEPGTGWTVPNEQIIQRSEEQNPGDVKPTGILSRICKTETCSFCGAPTQEDQHYCNKCGRKLR
ncbi:MAG: tetratricopeptide repeat protein [Candidatus Cloacimonetes bacterium]|nr:tetratricopeptide repeat protein [Candidatus Cloacimonadota bacterium]